MKRRQGEISCRLLKAFGSDRQLPVAADGRTASRPRGERAISLCARRAAAEPERNAADRKDLRQRATAGVNT